MQISIYGNVLKVWILTHSVFVEAVRVIVCLHIFSYTLPNPNPQHHTTPTTLYVYCASLARKIGKKLKFDSNYGKTWNLNKVAN